MFSFPQLEQVMLLTLSNYQELFLKARRSYFWTRTIFTASIFKTLNQETIFVLRCVVRICRKHMSVANVKRSMNRLWRFVVSAPENCHEKWGLFNVDEGKYWVKWNGFIGLFLFFCIRVSKVKWANVKQMMID